MPVSTAADATKAAGSVVKDASTAAAAKVKDTVGGSDEKEDAVDEEGF